MLKLYHSNRLECLARQLVEIVRQSPPDPFAREVIVTQHQGMARWLSLQLAQALGVAANLEFPFPAAFIWRLYHSQLPHVPEHSGFDRQALAWRVFAALPAWLDKPGFEPLKHYLRGDTGEVKAYQLARRVADVFDQYLIYRPEWIAAWENGEDEHWQAQLWRALVGGQGRQMHRAGLYQAFRRTAERGGLDRSRLPPRVCVFGIGTLPPSYLEVLALVGELIEVHVFLLNPSQAWWADIVDERSLARLRARWRAAGREQLEEYYASGNSLLASMGKQGKDFLGLLYQFELEEHDLFEPAPGAGLLAQLQNDILELRERGVGEQEPAQLVMGDRSLQIHVVHSAMREVQVLHDQLLALFEAHPDLRPNDVVVMMPDIDRYAPYVEAVFGTAPDERAIPWAVVERSSQAEHPILSTFLQLMGLPQSRFTASEILAILEVPAVARTLRLDEGALERMRQWIMESGVRWGLDADDRGQLDLPATADNTWAFGLRRLMLGYAMPPGTDLYRETAPYAAIEGGEARWLGVLQSFIDRLRRLRRQLSANCDAMQWQDRVNELLTLFSPEDDTEHQALQSIRDAMAGLVEHTTLAHYAEPLALAVVRDYLKGHLTELGAPQRFLCGQVNFCAMMPMRSIPFRVVCLLGMNDRDYPRARAPLGFDRMALRPRPGDRSRRDDDRYLFLEAVLSARDYLYISYVGRSIRDNSSILPSVLVSELLDYVEQGYYLADRPLREHLVTEHALQPFSHRYFAGDSRLFSYAAEWLAGSQALGQRDVAEPVFIDAQLAPAPDISREVTLEELIQFFRNPSERFLLHRFGLRLVEQQDLPEDSEVFALDQLQQYQLKQRQLEACLHPEQAPSLLPRLRAEGVLPYGGFGDYDYASCAEPATAVAARVAVLRGTPVEVVGFALALGDFTLSGSLAGLTRAGVVSARCAKGSGGDRLKLWLCHLVLNCVRPEGAERRSVHVAQDKEFVLEPLDDPEIHLSALLELYWQGLTRPLPFFPKTSYAYIEQWRKANDLDKAMAAARRVWQTTEHNQGEQDNPYVRVAFRGRDALGAEFVDCAMQVFGPLMDHVGEGP